MSKIGKKPINIPQGTVVVRNDEYLIIKRNDAELKIKIPDSINVEIDDQQKNILITVSNSSKQIKSDWGSTASLIKNALSGLEYGYTKELEIEGIGYKAAINNNKLTLNVGFTHQIEIIPPANIKISVEKNVVKISGIDKQAVGEIAAKIRNTRPPEPYQGKGIRYKNEVVRRKAGKKAAGSTTA